MRKVLSSRKMLCEEWLRAQRKQNKGQCSNKPKKKMIILSGAQRMHVLNVCGERLHESSLLCTCLSFFSGLLESALMITFCKFYLLLLIVIP